MNSPCTAPGAQPVAIEAMLAARDARAARQRAMLGEFGCPLISLTMVSPGPVKDTALARYVFGEALTALTHLLAAHGWPTVGRELVSAATGPEAVLAIECAPEALKLATIDLEDRHPLGRLWDMDVIGPDGDAISRARLGAAPRRCLVCAEAAHACARSRAHSLEQLLQVIEERVNGYQRSLAR